jgi:hypothetical protein
MQTMTDQDSRHKSFVVGIAEEVGALLTLENRAFLAAKCEEFWQRVEGIEIRCKKACEECGQLTRELGPRWHCLNGVSVIERRFVLRAPKKWPVVDSDAKVAEFCRRVEKVETQREDPNDPFNVCRQQLALRWEWSNISEPTQPNKPRFIRVKRQFYCNPTVGDPRHWFPPHAVWWKEWDVKEELPNEQDELLRDCVLIVLIYDLTFSRHKPVYFRSDRVYPGGSWWHELLYRRTLQEMAYIRDSNSSDIEHFKACIRKSLENVAEACKMREPPVNGKTTKIFLASSEELREDRDAFELYFRQQNDQLRKQGLYLQIVRWENFLDAMSETRLQDEYNGKVRACDIFVSLFMTKTGTYTEEEFDVAHEAFKQAGKPVIYTFFKEAQVSTSAAHRDGLTSLWSFQEKLKQLGHFYTPYKSIEDLKLRFKDQLEKLREDGRL